MHGNKKGVMQMFDCVILAGGEKNELARQEGVANKALLKIGGKEMVRTVLDVFRQIDEINKIVLVGPEKELSFLKGEYPVEILPESNSLMGNLVLAARFLGTKNYLLISSSDTPLLSTASVTDFIRQCLPLDYDFYYPIVAKEESEKMFPGEKRTFIILKEGTFTGGNLFLVNPAHIEPLAPSVEKFLECRKNPVKMASLLGTGFVFGLLMKRLSLSQLEERASNLLQIKAKAVISSYPEIGFDVDKPSDLEIIRRKMYALNKGGGE